jgi:PPOX class probable F420-dependent enzyme
MAVSLPDDVRALLDAPNYVHLSTLRTDGSPRNWVVWVGVEGDHLLICTGDSSWKARDMRRDPRVGISVADMANPYRMAASRAGSSGYARTRTAGTWTPSR